MMLSRPLPNKLFLKITDACISAVPVGHYFLKLTHVSHSPAFFAASKL